ncbi:MAG: lysine--tRNA ligase [Proteobacteria bacterium]|nr:lysine--tRNA ligase [Pseudomonadota bacterium]
MPQTFSPEQYLNSAAWPFAEARRVIAHMEAKAKAGKKDKGYILFETGYGPSGLPHIGTFGEVFRTTMVRQAFERLMPGVKTRLFAFSDDMDGLRKVPENLPNKELLKAHLNKPLTQVPDPFGQYPSFAHHNNAMLRRFLDDFGFAYEFLSSTEQYKSGIFNTALLRALEVHKEICDIIVPTLGQERAATYSPFLPVDAESGHVLQVPVIATDVKKGTITYRRTDGKEIETPVTDGHCKLQWKPDWAMRWYALDVDYEMSGKDLIDSVQLGSRICTTLGGTPPVNLTYEHFVDEQGAKISKSKGNGLTIEEWLTYAPAESLSLYMYRTPTRQKKLYRTLIPTVVEEYATLLDDFPTQTPEEQLDNPAFHIHNGTVPANPLPFPYPMLLNLVSVTAAEKPEVVWNYLMRYRPDLSPQNAPQLATLIEGAIRYYADTIKPTQNHRAPATAQERATLDEIAAFLKTLQGGEDAELIQTEFYEIGKRQFSKEKLRDYFKFLYQTLLGFENGPRLGTFTTVYGHKEMLELVTRAQSRT